MRAAASSRQAFVRTRVPVAERIAASTIVALLAALAAAIVMAGRHFDATRYAPDPARLTAAGDASTLPATAPAGAGAAQLGSPAATADGTATTTTEPATREPATAAAPAPAPAPATATATVEEEYSAAAARPAHAVGDDTTAARPASAAGGAAAGEAARALDLASEPAVPGVQSLRALGDTEVYGPDNLFEKIDGRAPAYLGFQFRRLTCRGFAGGGGAAGDTADFIDVYLFEMGSPLDAYGIFAMERDPAGQALDYVADGYESGPALFFRQGVFYAQVLASDPGLLTAARTLARAVAGRLTADDSGMEARRALPAAGLIAASVQFVPENAQGLPFLKDVYEADYRVAAGGGADAATVRYFICTPGEAQAAAAWADYRAFCAKYGQLAPATGEIGGREVFFAEVLGNQKAIYRDGGRVGGVVAAPDRATAEAFLRQVLGGGKADETGR